MYLHDFINQVRPNITGYTEHLWSCFGDHARYMDCGEDLRVIFDTESFRIYQISCGIGEGDDAVIYIWIDPEYRKAYFAEEETLKPVYEWEMRVTDTPQEIIELIQRDCGQ